MDLKTQLERVAKNHQASIQNLETNFDRLAEKQSSRPSGSLPSNTQPTPRGGKAYQPSQARIEHVNAVFTRSDGTEQMIFNIDSAMKHSYLNDDTCFSINVINEILEEDFDALLDEGSKIPHSIEGTLLEEEIFSEFDEFIAMTVDENSESEFDNEEPPFEKIIINTDYKIKTSLEEPPTDFELKPLPDNFKLVSVLKKHKESFAWKMTDILGICPSFCKHKIQLLDDKKPVIQKQRRLNLNMQEVVKKETVKLLDTGIIYSIADSPWASPIHCVLKKGSITVVTNKMMIWSQQELLGVGDVVKMLILSIEKKCHFMVKEGIVLGHKVSSTGLEVDKAKIDVISKLPSPTNIKDTPFEFSEECQKAFEILKEKLTSTPVIASPNWNLSFELMCDASDFAVGAVIEIKDEKGTENVAADHLSRIENDESSDDSEVDDNFPGETLMEINTKDEPWFADLANYLVANIILKGMTYQQKYKFFFDLKHYFWEEPYLFKYGNPSREDLHPWQKAFDETRAKDWLSQNPRSPSLPKLSHQGRDHGRYVMKTIILNWDNLVRSMTKSERLEPRPEQNRETTSPLLMRRWAFGAWIKVEWKPWNESSFAPGSTPRKKREWPSFTILFDLHPTGSMPPFIRWIEDYTLPDGLKIPSHIGSYNGKGDPDNYLHLFERAIHMQKWKTYTWIEAKEVATNGAPNDQRESFERSKKTSRDNNRGQGNRDRQSFDHTLASKRGSRRCTWQFTTSNKEKARVSELSPLDLLSTYKGLMEKTCTCIKARKVTTNGAPNDQRDNFERRSCNPRKRYVEEDYNKVGEITFPHILDKSSANPVIIKAYVSGRQVNRVYMDNESLCEVIYEHYFLKLKPSIRSLRAESKTPLVGFFGEYSWPLGEVPLEITIGEGLLTVTKTLNFVIVRSDSPHNLLLGRTAMQQMGDRGPHSCLRIDCCPHDMSFKNHNGGRVEEGRFSRHLITKQGIKADPLKVKGISDLQPPKLVSKDIRAELEYPKLEKLILALVYAARKLRRYFQAHPIQLNPPKQDREIKDREAKRKEPEVKNAWKLFTDGASSSDGSGAGLMLVNPEGKEYTYALRFEFETTNNEAEYEALLTGLRIAKEMKIQELIIIVDSQLVANQVNRLFEARQPVIKQYLEKIILVSMVKMRRSSTCQEHHPRGTPGIMRNACGIMIGPLPMAPGGARFLVVAIDYFTKWVEEKPLISMTGKHMERFAHSVSSVKNSEYSKPSHQSTTPKQTDRTTLKSSNEETPFSLVYGSKAVILIKISVETRRNQDFDPEKNKKRCQEDLYILKERREIDSIKKAHFKQKWENTITNEFGRPHSNQEHICSDLKARARQNSKERCDPHRKAPM
nr:reverse transcriptase domain-containing protein [Tanacetum cinerariifolium]